MAEAGSLNIDLILNSAKFKQGMDKAKASMSRFEKSIKPAIRSLKKMGKTMSNMGANMSRNLTLPLALAGGAVVKLASDFEEVDSKFKTIFNSMSAESEKVATDLAKNFGLSQRASKELLSGTGDLLTGFGFSQDAALGMSKQVQELAVDLASFTNFSGGAEGASAAITKALLGEREAIKGLGKSVQEKDVKERLALLTSQGITFETERQAKAFVVLQLIQEQSKNAIGDFARTQDSFANQLRITKATLEDVAVELGTILLPIAKKVLTSFKGLVNRFKALSPAVKKTVLAVAGLVAAIGPALFIFGKISSLLATLLPLLGALSLPIVAIGAAIAATAALIFFNWDSIVAYFSTGEGAGTWDIIKQTTADFLDVIKELFNVAVNIIVGIWDKFGGALMSVISSAMEFSMSIIGNQLALIGDLFFAFSSLLKGDWQGVWDGIISALVNSFQFMIKVFIKGKDIMLSIVQKVAGIFSDDLADGVGKARGALQDFKNGAISFTDTFKRVPEEADVASTAMSTLAKIVGGGGGGDSVEGAFKKANGEVVKFLSFADGFDKFKQDAVNAAESIKRAFEPIVDFIKPIIEENRKLADSFVVMGGISAGAITKFSEDVPEGIAPAQQAILEFGDIVQGAMSQTAAAVGEGIAAMVTGAGSIGGVLNSVMVGIADFVSSFGKAMIAASTAAMLAKAALATPASLAAGVALVALSGVLKSVISSKPMGFAEGGLVMGETLGLVGEGSGTSRSNPEVIAPLDKLKDFMRPESSGSSGGLFEFEIRGETLRTVLKNNSSSRAFNGLG